MNCPFFDDTYTCGKPGGCTCVKERTVTTPDEQTPCQWPQGTCACYMRNAQKPDPHGRVWMHCEEGLNLTKASMSRFVMYCLTNNVEIGDIHPFNYRYPRSQVSVSVRIRPEQFEAFEAETGGKLRKPPRISLNSSTAEDLPHD